ncbi:uncharacterized protein DNG_06354 [Cephalotrichum gorgonifer]|uniref:Uncharacterized protein n=1 Tax=Cephalotrichum gorgonifer TaxID=2041049 RepID=A0AAE8MZL8_9PEZI|nr:uncharacterized protein DNG_06354 [Cephalotrichum gorgonifer]
MKGRVGFFDMPAEIRDEIYKELVMFPEVIYLDYIFGPLRECFLDQSGLSNAQMLRHFTIPFPYFRIDTHHLSITLQDDSDGVQVLDLIHQRCRGIVTLEMSLDSSHAMEIQLDKFDSPRAADQALVLVDERFKIIPLLKELRVHLYDEPIDLSLREKMGAHGWVIETTEQSDRDRFSQDSFDYDDYDYGDYDDYDHSGYDTDMRRAEEEWWDDFDRRNASD